ncbi:hypothetical protein GC176_23795 [bacterium]|nr:hypothetical protein [bacterium]
MSDESSNAASETQQLSRRKSRSPIEKVVWGIIALVILGLGLELYAKTSYEKTMATLDDVFNHASPETQRLSDVRHQIVGLTQFAEPVQSGNSSTQEEIEVSWVSPWKKYSVTLVVEKGDDDPVVAWYKMGADNWVVDLNEPADGSATADPQGMMAGGGSMPAGMAGGGPPSHDAQADGGGGSGGGSGGEGRGRGPRGLLGMLAEEAVIAEINLTPEQTEKLDGLAETLQVDFRSLQDASPEERAAVMEKSRTDTEAAVKGVLDEKQFGRVWQIDLQRAGLAALGRKNVASQLNLSDEQSAELAGILADADAARTAARETQNFAAFGEIREQTEQKIQDLLTDEQKSQWKELLGPPGPERPQRSGFGGGRGGAGGGSAGDSGRPQRPASDESSESAPAAGSAGSESGN